MQINKIQIFHRILFFLLQMNYLELNYKSVTVLFKEINKLCGVFECKSRKTVTTLHTCMYFIVFLSIYITCQIFVECQNRANNLPEVSRVQLLSSLNESKYPTVESIVPSIHISRILCALTWSGVEQLASGTCVCCELVMRCKLICSF